MYRNLQAEMGRQAMTKRQLAEALGKTTASLSQKMNKKVVWTLPEALLVRKTLKCEKMDIGELFEWSE